MTPDAFVTAWRQRAAELEPYAPAAAVAFRRAADELQDALHATEGEPLTLEEASQAGGYSVDHLRREVRRGHIPNAGRKNAPRIRRADVPRKPGHIATLTPPPFRAISPAQIARAVVNPQHTAGER